MPNWWHHWATQIACALAQVWLRSRANRHELTEEERTNCGSSDPACPRTVPTPSTNDGPVQATMGSTLLARNRVAVSLSACGTACVGRWSCSNSTSVH